MFRFYCNLEVIFDEINRIGQLYVVLEQKRILFLKIRKYSTLGTNHLKDEFWPTGWGTVIAYMKYVS